MVSLFDALKASKGLPANDPIAGIWGKKLAGGKIQETEGTLPLTINANGEPLIDYKIYGNTTQSGTPDPDNPVDVVGCGVRTENLFDRSDETQFIENTNLSGGNTWAKYDGAAKVLRIACEPVTTYTLKIFGNMSGNSVWRVSYTSSDSIPIGNNRVQTTDIIKTTEYNEATFTTDSTTKYILIQVSITYNDTLAATLTLTEGSTAPVTYVPYGYKLPMTTTNGADTVTTPVYIGVEPLHRISEYADYVDYTSGKIVRKIKKLVLTGEEGWLRTQNRRYYIDASTGCPTDYLKQKITISICSHYQSQNNTASGSNEVKVGHLCFYTGYVFELYIGETTISSAADFKTYLQQQYANGTPVTVWYVLATPVEEDPPVALPALPTLDGTTVYDADLLTKPSKMYVKYRKHGTRGGKIWLKV